MLVLTIVCGISRCSPFVGSSFDQTTKHLFDIMSTLVATVYKEHLMGRLPSVAMEEQIEAIADTLQINQQIEQAFSDTERSPGMCQALEDLAFAVGQIREITPKEAALIQIAGDMAVAGSGETGSAVTPAMEDILNGKFSAGDVVKKVRDTVASILAAIRELIRRVGTYVTSYVSRVTVVAGGSETRLKKLKAAFAAYNGSYDTRGKTVSMVLPTIGGKVVSTMDELLEGTRALLKTIENFTRVANDVNYNFGSGIVRLYEIKLGKGEEADLAAVGDQLLEQLKRISGAMDVGRTIPNRMERVQSDGTVTYESPSLIGGIKLVSSHIPLDSFEAVNLHSSTSVRDFVGRCARKNSLLVNFEDGATTGSIQIEPMDQRQLRETFDLIVQLLGHYSGRASNTSLTAAMQKRSAFAKQCCAAVSDRVKNLDQTNPLAYGMTVESLSMTDAITRNATLPYLRLSETAGRVISYLLTAASKSLAAHAKDHDSKTSPAKDFKY